MYEAKRHNVPIPKNPMLKPIVERVRPRMPGILRAELRKQLRRNGIKRSLS